jgi:membrane protein implicated in regulation of membrane protease activity
VIRFGVVLSVVLIAIGLLATGVVAGSLLLVVISIGVALLAFLLLIGVVISYRHEIFSRRAPQAVARGRRSGRRGQGTCCAGGQGDEAA